MRVRCGNGKEEGGKDTDAEVHLSSLFRGRASIALPNCTVDLTLDEVGRGEARRGEARQGKGNTHTEKEM